MNVNAKLHYTVKEETPSAEKTQSSSNNENDKQFFNSGYSMKKPDYETEPAKDAVLSQGIFYIFMIASVLLFLKMIFLP